VQRPEALQALQQPIGCNTCNAQHRETMKLPGPKGRNQRIALEALKDAVNMNGKPRHDLALNRFIDSAKIEDVYEQFCKLALHTTSQHAASRFSDAMDGLLRLGYVQERGGWISIVPK